MLILGPRFAFRRVLDLVTGRSLLSRDMSSACDWSTCLRELLWEGGIYSHSLHSGDLDEPFEQRMSERENALHVTLTRPTRMSPLRSGGGRSLWATNKETSALPLSGRWALDRSLEVSGFSDSSVQSC